MPFGERSELYFIVAMMFLILLVCTVAVYAFFKTYRKEMREKELRLSERKIKTSADDAESPEQQ